MSEISVENLNFGYDENLVLKDINFEYKKSDFLSIIGPNGGGKSTLLKLLLGLLTPHSGSIKVYGKNPTEISSSLGYVPQHIPLNLSFPISVLEVVLMGQIGKKLFGFYDKADKEKAMNALELVGMQEFKNRRISALSGGQRQRIYIARALCSDAKILLLDEPTASIDVRGQAEIYELLKELNFKGTGVIMISHDTNIAINFATKIAYINKTLVMHDIDNRKKDDFLSHFLKEHNSHFCDVELVLKECSCKK
ncbi:metal ABC transporter ATP-binding protein [Campylobacter geochelonis]|uniref:metal ABC transporter ATP-binding protein n=1 Tax=Campylobacter geochelonis TaxID=1780362 RepID=UPI00077093F3|nr:ABC transporter ATP-binding protein [Campylobacter geochelonis]CZE46445.1 ABC transporter ATP-binding protein [Campylobacter geochelonis]